MRSNIFQLGQFGRRVAASASAVPSYASEVLSDSPLGFWRLNDGPSSFADSSGNSRNLSGSGTFRTGLSALHAGSLGCVESDGESAIAVQNNSAFDILGNLTVEFVVVFQGLPGSGRDYTILAHSPTSTSDSESVNYNYSVRLLNSGGTYRWTFFHETGAGTNIVASVDWAPTVGVPYHVVVTRDTSALEYEVWVDGSSIGTGSYSTNPTGGTGCELSVFRAQDALDNGAPCMLSELSIYSSKLSGGRIAAHYAALGSVNTVPTTYQKEVLADAPFAFWPLNRPVTGPSYDIVGLNTLSVTGSVDTNEAGLHPSTGKCWEFRSASAGAGAISDDSGFRTTGSWTYECLFKHAALPGDGVEYQFFGIGTSGETASTNVLAQILIVNTSGVYTLAWFHESGSGTNNSGSVTWTPTADTVYHFAVVKDSAAKTYTFYINGVSVGSSSYVNEATGGTSGQFEIARNPTNAGNSFSGFQDEIAFYKSALSGARIAAHYAALIGDPYAANVVAHLHFDGTDGSTTIIDATGRIWTASGNAQIDTAESKFGGASLLLDGTGDYVSTANAAALSIGGSDFTIEAWIRLNATGRVHTISNKRDGSGAEEHSFSVQASDTLSFAAFSGGSPIAELTSATVLTTGVWYAVAVTRSGSTWRLFLDGVIQDTDTQAGSAATNTAPLIVGRDGFNTSRDFNGWIDEYRFTNGVARYTSNYTPAASAFPSL